MFVVELLALIVGAALLQKKQTVTILKSPITVVLGLYLAVLAAASLLGIDPLISFWSKATRVTGLFFFIHLALIYLFLTTLFQKREDMRTLLKVLLVSTGLFSLGSFLGPEGLGLTFSWVPWDGFYFGNSTFAAMYLFAAFLLSLYYVITSPTTKHIWWKYVTPLVFLINPYIISKELWFRKVDIIHNPFSLVGEARSTTYALVGAVILFLILRAVAKVQNTQLRSKIMWGGTILGFVLIAAAAVSLMSPNGFVRDAYLSQGTNARPLVWQLSSDMIAERPVLGWGTDNFETAFVTHYDNKLLTNEGGKEAWFDRAHNVLIDQTVDSGYLGLLVYLLMYIVTICSLVYVILRTKDEDDRTLAQLLMVYFIFHFAELQTAFDTSISLMAVTIMAALATVLFHRTYTEAVGKEKTEYVLPIDIRRAAGAVLILYFGWAFIAGTWPIMKAEHANGQIRTIGSSEKRLPLYDDLFGSPMDQQAFLWRTSTDFQRGIGEDPSILDKAGQRELFVKELTIFEARYQEYLDAHPHDIRALFSLADLYMYDQLFGVDHLQEAHDTLDTAIALNPDVPQGYWMKAVAFLYQKDFENARLWAQKGIDVNPDIEMGHEVADYIEKSIQTFPNVELYFFRYI